MKPFERPIYVTRPFLPPLSEFAESLQEIWDSCYLTNSGPILKRFENKLAAVFQSPNTSLFANGSLALQIGLRGLNLSGEVITTPFTYVATAHALLWNDLKPVFADIEADYFTLNPEKVEALITTNTSAILAVHVFGFPCRLEPFAALAEKHGLALIYDAAHAFGVRVNGLSIALYGNLSMFSFHATKHFHSIEGGAIVYRDPQLKSWFERMTNNGFDADGNDVGMLGTNTKMNEFQALMGEQMLNRVESMVAHKRRIASIYRERLSGLGGIAFCPELEGSIEYNYCFMPVQIIEEEFGETRDYLFEELTKYNIFTKKYFSPLVPNFKYYLSVDKPDPLIVARRIESRILSLPIYPSLELADVQRICDIIENIRINIK